MIQEHYGHINWQTLNLNLMPEIKSLSGTQNFLF